jgi:NAD(P)H-hydrate epimerase
VRSGSGLVYVGVPESIHGIISSKSDEAMGFPLPCNNSGCLSSDAIDPVLSRLQTCGGCLIGPGLGRSDGAEKLVSAVIRSSKVPLVIDADGINAVSKNIDILRSATCPIVLTPHEGEFSRLGGDVSAGRIKAASDFAKSYSCTLVLKGHRTVSAFPSGRVVINTTGNPGMAKGGSGDVLAGVIASLIGQRMALDAAVSCAVYIHGLAGDLAAARLGEYSMTPSDMLCFLAEAFKSVKKT